LTIPPCLAASTNQAHRTTQKRPAHQSIVYQRVYRRSIVEVWAMDEHRIGLKPLVRRVWAPIGRRPLASVRHRFVLRYLVGFVHPASGRTVFHLATSVSIPLCETELAAFARSAGARPKKEIVLVLDWAGWHTSLHLRVPEHLHLFFLPTYSLESQPAEHLWSLTDEALVNQCFADIEGLEEAQLPSYAALQHQPQAIQSSTLFPWWPRRLKKRQGPQRQGPRRHVLHV